MAGGNLGIKCCTYTTGRRMMGRGVTEREKGKENMKRRGKGVRKQRTKTRNEMKRGLH